MSSSQNDGMMAANDVSWPRCSVRALETHGPELTTRVSTSPAESPRPKKHPSGPAAHAWETALAMAEPGGAGADMVALVACGRESLDHKGRTRPIDLWTQSHTRARKLHSGAAPASKEPRARRAQLTEQRRGQLRRGSRKRHARLRRVATLEVGGAQRHADCPVHLFHRPLAAPKILTLM